MIPATGVMHILKMNFISNKNQINYVQSSLVGLGVFIGSACIGGLIYIYQGDVAGEIEESWISLILGGLFIGPAVESYILLLMVLLAKKIPIKSTYAIIFIAFLLMLAHIPAKENLMGLPIQFFAFFVFSKYLFFRRNYANKKICWFEAFLMHAIVNSLSTLPYLLSFYRLNGG